MMKVSILFILISFTLQSPSSFYNSKSFFLSLSPSFTLSPLETTFTQGHITSFSLSSDNTDFALHPNITYVSSDPTVAIVHSNLILGVNVGTATITSYLFGHELSSTVITVTQPEIPQDDEEHIKKAEEILATLTIEQKLGQMFVVGFDGTVVDDTLIESIETRKFGNVIYMQRNVEDYPTLVELTTAVQNKIINETTIPGFVSIDQEGGNVVRLFKGGTHFLGAMAMSATNNSTNSRVLGAHMGKELMYYGINTDFTPSLDVNNNPYNPIIGIRSYSDDPIAVAKFGQAMYDGLAESNVLGCVKHFPGHGNTDVDSHVGLPVIKSSMDELYAMELAPFISSIRKGIDSLMTTHIIFEAIDKNYPATLSQPVVTDLLRNQLKYNGIIFTDGMEMKAVAEGFGGFGRTGVLAVQAGVDILLYTTNANDPRVAYDEIMKAINNGTISIERIDESVKRILTKKIKLGIYDNWQPRAENITQMLQENEELNQKFANESLTLVKGEFTRLNKTKTTLILSPAKTNVILDPSLETNSFAEYACKYLKEKGGMKVCDMLVVNNKMSEENVTQYLSMVNDYEQIVIALSNIQTNKYNTTAKFVNSVLELDKEVVIVALETPYDLMIYNKEKVKTYICTYNYQRATMISLSTYLNGELVAKGRLPIDKSIFE